MPKRPDDICPKPPELPQLPAAPHAPAIHVSSVYECTDPEQAAALLAHQIPGYVYGRDGHPNADMLAEKCRRLHAADRAAVTASGMAAVSLAVLSQLTEGDHIVVSSQLYGASLGLLAEDTARLGIQSTVVDTCDLDRTRAALTDRTRMIVAESITNPILRVSDISALADLAHQRGALLLVDNTLASPVVCRPLEWGADLVLESLTKIMSGHSDVVLGLLCGRHGHWSRVPTVLSRWGLASSPFDAWLALRGLSTLAVRARQASANALRLAEMLEARDDVKAVHYPGLAVHSDHALAQRQFSGQFGSLVTCTLPEGRGAAEAFLAATPIPFCPSLGELSTTVSHPESTSHRNLSDAECAALGIEGGTLRLSIGIESYEEIEQAVIAGLNALG